MGNSMIRTWLSLLFSEEHRRAARSKAPPLIAYFWDGGHPVGHPVKNISSRGFFLTTEERWLIGTMVMITLQRTQTDSTQSDSSLIVMSKVVHHADDGVGFTFIPVENAGLSHTPGYSSHAADRKALDRFLQRLAADHLYS